MVEANPVVAAVALVELGAPEVREAEREQGTQALAEAREAGLERPAAERLVLGAAHRQAW